MAAAFEQFARSRWLSVLCMAVVLLAAGLPPEGLVLPGRKPLPVCQFKEVTHLPCPGCGLTRSFVGIAHLDFARAARFHPLGLVLFPLVLFFALLLPVRQSIRERIAAWGHRHGLLLNIAFWGLLAALLIYGFARMLWLVLIDPQANIW